MLKKKLENNSMKPRDLPKNRHSDSLKKSQLTLSQGMSKKGDDVADDDDGNAVRTSVLRNRGQKHCVLRNSSSGLSIYSSPSCKLEKKWGGGGNR